MALPSLTELGLLRQHTDQYTPWWTTLDGDADSEVFQGERLDFTAKAGRTKADRTKTDNKSRDSRPRKRRAVSPDDQHAVVAHAVPDDEDVPELEDADDADDSLSPESSPESSPEPSPQTSPQTSPETATADLALPIRRLLPPHYLLPLPLPSKAAESAPPHTHSLSTTLHDSAKRKRDAPPKLAMANLLSPAPHVYCLYKFDRVDQLGGRRRGMRVR